MGYLLSPLQSCVDASSDSSHLHCLVDCKAPGCCIFHPDVRVDAWNGTSNTAFNSFPHSAVFAAFVLFSNSSIIQHIEQHTERMELAERHHVVVMELVERKLAERHHVAVMDVGREDAGDARAYPGRGGAGWDEQLHRHVFSSLSGNIILCTVTGLYPLFFHGQTPPHNCTQRHIPS